MRPSMAGDLVAICLHSVNQARPISLWVIDGSFAEISACDKEGSLDIILLKTMKLVSLD